MPAWTILIATLGRRKPKLERLLSWLLPQVDAACGQVTIEALWNHGERPICQVRQDLLDHATARYVSFVDDDDAVSDRFVRRVLPLLDGNVHYIGWRMRCFIDGRPLIPTFHSLRYRSWTQDARGFYRDISHINPVRRDLTAGTSFCAGWPEDSSWAAQMRGRLRTERFIEEEMYFYRCNTADSVQLGRPEVRHDVERPEVGSPWFSWHPASSP